MFKKSLSLLITVFALLGCQTAMTADGMSRTGPDDGVSASAPLLEKVSWFDGKRQRSAWLSEQEFVEFSPTNPAQLRQRVPAAVVVKEVGGVRIWRVAGDKRALRRVLDKGGEMRLSPVFHLNRSGGPRMALTGRVVIRFKPDWSVQQIRQWADQQQLTLLKPILQKSNIYLFEGGAGLAALAWANEIQRTGEVVYATPDWWQEAFLR